MKCFHFSTHSILFRSGCSWLLTCSLMGKRKFSSSSKLIILMCLHFSLLLISFNHILASAFPSSCAALKVPHPSIRDIKKLRGNFSLPSPATKHRISHIINFAVELFSFSLFSLLSLSHYISWSFDLWCVFYYDTHKSLYFSFST